MQVKTYTGRRFDLMNMDPADIDIRDIAHHLSICNRWAGASRSAFSVAQHSVFVAQLCPQEKKLKGLLHDASDYLLGDMIAPIKHDPRMAFFRTLEQEIQNRIYMTFDITPGEDIDVKAADMTIQAMEARDLMGSNPKEFGLPVAELPPAPLIPWPAELAERRFLEAFEKFSRIRPRAIHDSAVEEIY